MYNRFYGFYPLLLTFIFLIKTTTGFNQTKDSSFILEGKINIDTGYIKLYAATFPACYPLQMREKTAKIENGHFTFEGLIPTSAPFILKMGYQYLSSPFFIEPGNQSIICNIDSLREIPHILNKSTIEYKDLFLPTVNRLNSGYVNFELSQRNIIEYISSYSDKHKDSYVALWSVAIALSKQGYSKELQKAFDNLSLQIKNSQYGKKIKLLFESASTLAIGAIFPILDLLDTNNKAASIPILDRKSKFTLIDFWFSNCGPCRQQFPKLRKLYQAYEKKGFNVLGISVDKQTKVSDWKRVILEDSLIWPQYLDMDGNKATNLTISYFPTNFLIDNFGKIVARDISMVDLEKFLSGQLL